MRRAGSNAQGLERTIKALLAAGRLNDQAEALLALARGLATAVDQDPANAALWREYRAALNALATTGADDVDDDTAQWLVSIRTPGLRAPVGDTTLPGP